MAVDAIITQPCENERIPCAMAIHTTQCDVRTHQGESILLEDLGNGIHQPVLRRMAAYAIVPNALVVDIGMTGDTIAGRCFIKIDGGVALLAIDRSV